MLDKSDAVDVVRGFPGLRALVIGDAMLDSWLEGEATRLCTEAPVPVVSALGTSHCAGGAANTALNLAALGAEVRFIALVGNDSAAISLRQALQAGGVDDGGLVADDAVSTLHKLRVVANGQCLVRFDEGRITQASAQSRRRMSKEIARLFARSDLVVVSDYCHGGVPDEIVSLLARVQSARRPRVVIDSKQIARFATCPATMVTPNLQEAARAVHLDGAAGDATPVTHAVTVAGHLRARLSADFLAVTMAEHGVLLTGPSGEQSHHPCHPVRGAKDVGAGDTFTAAAALALASAASPAQAVRIGIEAAAIAISRSRTATVSAQDLLRRVSLDDPPAVLSRQELTARLEVERGEGKRVVFTNGVFDILHAGHVNLLRRARALGDILVVGVNSDASTRRLKGPNRPVNRDTDRLALVSALDAVDYATLFDEDTPAALIRALKPHIHVKGGDYQAGALPEIDAVREVGARVEILPLVDGRSTTAVIDRILAGAPDRQVGQAG